MVVRAQSGGGGDKTYIHTYTSYPSGGVFHGIGFKPKYIAVMTAKRNNNTDVEIYDESVSTTTYKLLYSATEYTINVGATNAAGFMSIDDDGFTLNNNYASQWTTSIYVVCIG